MHVKSQNTSLQKEAITYTLVLLKKSNLSVQTKPLFSCLLNLSWVSWKNN